MNPTRRPAIWHALVGLTLAWLATASLAQDSTRPSARPRDRAKIKAARDLTVAEAESVALAFVRENHPELQALLAQLKAMKPVDYERAVRELAQVSQSLAQIKLDNPRRYETGLAVWKARSRVDLIAARLPDAAVDSDQQGQLRQAVQALVDAQIRQQEVEKEILQERLRKLDANLKTLKETVVENRVQNLLRKSQRARRKTRDGDRAEAERDPAPAPSSSSPSKTSKSKGDPQP